MKKKSRIEKEGGIEGDSAMEETKPSFSQTSIKPSNISLNVLA